MKVSLVLISFLVLGFAEPSSAREFCRRIATRLAPYSQAEAEKSLVDLKYSPEIAKRISKDMPGLAREILVKQSAPVTVYRGDHRPLTAYDAYEPHVPGVRRPGNAVGQPDEIWITNDVRIAIGYAQKNGVGTGIVVQYEIPEFLLRDTANMKKTGNTQVRNDFMGSGEAPYVVRIAIMNGKTVPTDTKAVIPERVIGEWIPVPKRTAPAPVEMANPEI